MGFVLALVVVGSALTLLLVAAYDAHEVRKGNPARFEVFGVRVTSWGADEAQPAWTTDKIDPTLKPLAVSASSTSGRQTRRSSCAPSTGWRLQERRSLKPLSAPRHPTRPLAASP